MNSRQRLLETLAGRVADRVPISTYELVGYNSHAFENNDPSYARLMEFIREHTDCLCMWGPGSNETFLQSSHPVEIEVRESRQGNMVVCERRLRTPRGDLTQTTRVVDGIRTVWQVEHWCKSIDDVDRALSVPFEPLEFDVSDHARIQEEVGDNGLIMASVADALLHAADLMAFGDYTVWAITETEHFARVVEAMHERAMENLRRALDAVVADVYRICGPEYATPPYLPPALFERYVVPYVTDMVDLIHDRGAKARFHCHGRIGQVLDMIARTGADGLDPCEAPPDGDIELARVKERVGDKLCLFGNLQLKALERNSPEAIEALVKDCMAAAKVGGRYVIMPTAAPIDSPLSKTTEENYIRFIEAALEHGRY